jgi:hypothetical protein
MLDRSLLASDFLDQLGPIAKSGSPALLMMGGRPRVAIDWKAREIAG